MPTESQDGPPEPPGVTAARKSFDDSSVMDTDVISEGDINPSKDQTQPTSNTTTASNPAASNQSASNAAAPDIASTPGVAASNSTTSNQPAPNAATPDIASIMAQLIAMNENLHKFNKRLDSLEQDQPSLTATDSTGVPSSIKSPSTATTNNTTTAINSSLFQASEASAFPPYQTYATAASSTNSISSSSTKQRHAAETTAPTAETKPTSHLPPSNVFTPTPLTPLATSFQRQLKSSQQASDFIPVRNNSHINLSEAINQELHAFQTSVTMACKINPTLFRGILKTHKDDFQDLKIENILQECCNKLILRQFDANHRLFGVLICTEVSEDTSSSQDCYNITFDVAQSDATTIQSNLIYAAHYALLDVIQTLSNHIENLKKEHGDHPEILATHWADLDYHPLFGAIEFPPQAIFGNKPSQITLVSYDIQAREFQQRDKLSQHFIIRQIVKAIAEVDSTGSFAELDNLPLLQLHNMSFRAISFPNPEYQGRPTNQRTSKQRKNKSVTKFKAVATLVTSKTPFGQQLSKALVKVLWDSSTSTPNSIRLKNRSSPIIFHPIPPTESERNKLYNQIKTKQPSDANINVITGLPPGFNNVDSIHEIHLKKHGAYIEAINPSYTKSGDNGTAAVYCVMKKSFLGRHYDKETMKAELEDTLRQVNEASTNTSQPEASSTSQPPAPESTPNLNPLGQNALYDGGAVLCPHKGEQVYVCFFGKGGPRITISKNYHTILERTYEVRFNHLRVFPSLPEAFRASSKVYNKSFTCMEDITKHNFIQPLDCTNLHTHRAPPCLKHLHTSGSASNRKNIVAYPWDPESSEEKVHRYNASSITARQRFRRSSKSKDLCKSTVDLLTRIDASPHPLCYKDIERMILSHVNPADPFTFDEHSTIAEAFKKQSASSANSEENIPAAQSEDSLNLNEDVMSISSPITAHNDSQEYFVPSQDSHTHQATSRPTDYIDTSNKRLRHSSPIESPPTTKQIGKELQNPAYIQDHHCLVSDIPPFISIQDCEATMTKNGVFLSDTDDAITALLALQKVYLCQFLNFNDDNIPTHAVWICNGEEGYNSIKDILTKSGIFDTYTSTFTTRLSATDPLKVLQLDLDMEDPNPLAKFWKQNCPAGQEMTLYHHIKSKDQAALRSWMSIYRGKQANSL